MRQTSILIAILLMIFGCVHYQPEVGDEIKTICNPMDISYRFSLDEPSRREAADPSVIYFNDLYYLFASKSGGYWYSSDLVSWEFVETDEIPTEEYAPTIVVIGGTVYFMASSNTIYKSIDLLGGKWDVAAKLPFSVVDPALFLDDDDRLYFYWGCSDKNPIYGIELDYKDNFKPISDPVALIYANTHENGWEVPGDYNTNIENSPWIEGAWLNKFKGKYYLQYAGPGTQFKSYSDGVYISDSPMGPYELAAHNPFAYKPEGFATGAGHGSTFTDKYGNYWHIGTVTISQKHMFERRLALYPAFFDQDDVLYANTKYGDYPMIVPEKKIESFDEIFPEWMLLSYHKKVTVSSSVDSLLPVSVTDENIRTYWAAESGSDKEWACIDLGSLCDVYALQINFAEHNTNVFGRVNELCYQYVIECSNDNDLWMAISDQLENQSDNSHVYTQFDKKINCRFLRIRNKKVPGGKFALSGFRVFGKGNGDKPARIDELEVERNPQDKRSVHLTWGKSENAVGYNISYGIKENKLYQNYLVYQDTSVSINSLNASQMYFFTIEAFNENGKTPSEIVKMVE